MNALYGVFINELSVLVPSWIVVHIDNYSESEISVA